MSRPSVTITGPINPEQFHRALGAPVSTSGDYDQPGADVTVTADDAVAQADLDAAAASIVYDASYHLRNDPEFLAAHPDY